MAYDNAEFLDAFAHDIFPTVKSLQALSFVKRPLLAKLERQVRPAVGKNHNYPVLQQAAIAQGTTRAAVQEQNAQANDAAGFSGKEFTLGYFPPGYKGGFVTSSFDMALTRGSNGVPDGAYMELFGIKMRESGKEFGQRQERYFIGESGKSLAQSTANDGATTNSFGGVTDLSAGTIALVDRTKITGFRLNQILNMSTNDASTPASAALLGTGDDQKAYIIGLNFETGVITISDTSQGTAGHSALDTAAGSNDVFLWNLSDFQGSSGYTPNTMPPGFQDWVPRTLPSSENFQGVTRGSATDSRLCGWRLPTVAGEALDTVIIRALEEARTFYGVDGTYTVCASPRRWTQLTQIATARGYRMLDGGTATLGYKYIEIVHGDMVAEVLSVPSMSSDDLFFMKIEEDGWVVRTLGGDWPRIVNGDGLKVLRLTTEDAYEFRTECFFHYGTMRIGEQGRADISAIATE